MKFRKLILASAISSALLLAGCGGGSDSESDSGTGSNPGSTTGATFSLTGVVVKGVVKNGVVTAYELVGSSWVARGSATTNDKGEYMLAIPAALYKGGIVKIALTSNATTQMKCELSACGAVSFGEFYSAPSTTLETLVSSTNIAASGISNIPITPYTNLVAGRINALVKEDGIATQADVAGIAAAVRSVVGFEPLTTKAVDITNSAAFNAASTLEQTAAIMSAAVAELAKTSSQDVSTVVSNMASAYADGVFNESDTFQLSTLVQQWNDVQHDSSVKTVISSASAAVAAVDAQVEVVTTELADGTYTPTPSADLASFLNGLSEFYIVGGDHHLWLDDLVTSGTNQYSFQSKKQLTSTSLYTPESDYERYVLTTSGWSLLGDPDSVTLTPNTATGQINGVDNMGSFTMSGSCADIANTTFSSQLSALNNTSLSSYVDVNTRFPSGSYACAVTNNSNEPEISIQIWDNGTNSVSMSGVGQVTTLAELFTTTVPVDGASSISNGIYVSHGYQLMLVGDSSASQGQALLMNNTGGSYSIVANVASNGWVKETTNGVTIIRIADAIRSYITDDIHDGFYGFTEYDGRVQQVSYYMAANEPFIFMNKTAYDAIMAGHVLDTDDDGVADTVDPNPTDPNPEASATLASFINGVSEFYVAGIDDKLWVEGWRSTGSGSYSGIANSDLNVTSYTTYTPQNNSHNYHLRADGSWALNDESTFTLTIKTVNADGSINIIDPDSTNKTLSGNCYDLSGKSILAETQQLGSTSVIDISAKFSSGAYGCLTLENSVSTDYYIHDTSGLNVNGSTLASTDDLLISGTPSASNLIKPIYVSNNYILTLLGDASADSGIAQLWHRDSSTGSYVLDYESATGWSYQMINNAPILALSADIRTKVQDNADDGLFGFAVFMGKVQRVRLYSNLTQNESKYLMNKTAYDDILSGHSLDTDGDGYADTVDAALTDPTIH